MSGNLCPLEEAYKDLVYRPSKPILKHVPKYTSHVDENHPSREPSLIETLKEWSKKQDDKFDSKMAQMMSQISTLMTPIKPQTPSIKTLFKSITDGWTGSGLTKWIMLAVLILILVWIVERLQRIFGKKK